LLRLSEIVIAAPALATSLRAMVDELARLGQVRCALVGLAQDRDPRLRYLAHRGLPGREAHASFTAKPPRLAAQALALRHPAQAAEAGGGCLALPLLAGDRVLGVLGMSLRTPVPLAAWPEEMLCAAADYVTLALLGREPAGTAELRLTRRQRDVVFLLVEHGAANEQIAERLGLSARTVKIHLQAAYRQLGVRSRGEAIRLVLTRHAGWLDQERARRREAGRGDADER
jgi:DNA-binding CsgD family transcriptional regulator